MREVRTLLDGSSCKSRTGAKSVLNPKVRTSSPIRRPCLRKSFFDPAVQFGLHFVPLVEENYFLACLTSNAGHPAVARLREVLAEIGWRDILSRLPGYRSASKPGGLKIPRRSRCS